MDTKTFSVLDALAGRSYPTDSVTVHTDVAALYEYKALDARANDSQDPDQHEPRLEELRQRIADSALVVHMRGFAPRVMKELNVQARAQFKVKPGDMLEPGSEAFRWLNLSVLAASIIKVEKPDGSVDERVFEVKDVEKFEDFLVPEEFDNLANKAFELSLDAMFFDQAVTPDFS